MRIDDLKPPIAQPCATSGRRIHINIRVGIHVYRNISVRFNMVVVLLIISTPIIVLALILGLALVVGAGCCQLHAAISICERGQVISEQRVRRGALVRAIPERQQ